MDELITGLLGDEFDLTLTVEPLGHPKLQTDVLYTNCMGLYVGPDSALTSFPFLRKARISIEEANQVPILTDTAAHIEQGLPIPLFLMRHRLAYHFPFELTSFEAAIRLAWKGQGIAVLPERNAAEAVSSGRLRRIEVKGVTGPKFGRHQICATYSKGLRSSPEVRALIDGLGRALA